MFRKNLQHILALVCWATAFAAIALILRAGHPVLGHLVHSDAMYLPVLFDDLFARGGRLGDWFLTPAPYFFPDMPLYLLAWLSAADAPGQILAYAMLQTALATLALYCLARRALPAHRLLTAMVLSVLFIWLGLTGDDPFIRLFSSAHHYGAFIVSLLLLTLWLDQERQDISGYRGWRTVTIAVLVFLTTLSDALFLAQTVIPLLVTIWLCRHGAPAGIAPGRRILLLLAPALVATLSYKFLVAHPTRYSARLSLSRLPDNLAEMGKICLQLFEHQPLLALALLLSLGLGAWCFVSVLRKRPLVWLPRPLQLLAVFATLSCAATVAAMLLSKHILPVPRYLIGALSWPLMAGVFALAQLLGERFRPAGLMVCLGLSGLLGHQAWQQREVREANAYYYPEQVACIDRTLAAAGAHYGIAQYWDAKRLQAFSRHQLTLAQYTGELEPMKWITSERFFRPGYDFAIIAEQESPEWRLPRARLIDISGQPKASVSCGDRTVLLYDAGRLQTVVGTITNPSGAVTSPN